MRGVRGVVMGEGWREGRERCWGGIRGLRGVVAAKLQHLTASTASLFDFEAFQSEWGLPKAVTKTRDYEGYYFKAALLGLTDENYILY